MKNNLSFNVLKIQSTDNINGEDLKNLRQIYTPIIGCEAILLYEYLRDYLIYFEKNTFVLTFDNLALLLNLSLNALHLARQKLESLSLISTFEDNVREIIILQLEKPLNKTSLNKNALIKKQLEKTIGKSNFQIIFNEKTSSQIDTENLKEISASFNDIFKMNNNKDEEDDYISNDIIDQFISSQEINVINEEENLYEKILKYDTFSFFEYLFNKNISTVETNLFNYYIKNNYENNSLNLILFYIKKIFKIFDIYKFENFLNQLKKKNIIFFDDVENYIDRLLKKELIEEYYKKTLWKSTYINNLETKKNKLFN
ncbi:hypothetical protein [Mycoplasma sp. 1018B]|uniref:hypothetical protein n=1 Tax=Mycoplasma sp. 1018B TaxID=2967302 RepID=UPI00211CB59F|nr:hypothetical protein [Mycoplasma sp. 1018B]UUM19297.1 hypothetical protein NPA14_00245 [Mycoplasma sp. 1018B]